MATNTEHYNLVKPDYADAADVAQLNDNMDIIDSILWQLANAGADEELLKKVQEILDKIGETADTDGSTTLGSVFAKLNNIISGNETNETKIDTVIKLLGSGVQEWKEPGTYQFKVPETITKIKVTACGAGGGGAGGSTIYKSKKGSGGGGGGADAVVDKEYSVTPGSILQVTIGKGGAGGQAGENGKDGTATVIGEIVTLAGGKGGVFQLEGDGIGGEPGGSGGGRGGKGKFIIYSSGTGILGKADNGENSVSGKGGIGASAAKSQVDEYEKISSGGGGGASLGDGGNGAGRTSSDAVQSSSPGKMGSGGGAGGYTNKSDTSIQPGKAGGNGYAKFVWGY